MALAILIVLFSFLFIPLLTGMNMFRYGRSRTEMQEAARQAMDQMKKDLSRAMKTYPQLSVGLLDGDTPGEARGRVDFYVPSLTAGGTPVIPLTPCIRTDSSGTYTGVTIITYYLRVSNPTAYDVSTWDETGAGSPGNNPIDNPRALYRAEYIPADASDAARAASSTSPYSWGYAPDLQAYYNQANDTAGGGGRDQLRLLSHRAITPVTNMDLSFLDLLAEGDLVTIDMRLTRRDVRVGRNPSAELKTSIRAENLQ